MKKLLIALVLALASLVSAVPSFAQTNPIVSSSCSTTSITVTNTAQTLIAANGLRKILLIQNNHATGIVYFSFGSTVATTSLMTLIAGASYFASGTVPNQSISLIGSVASNATVAVLECS